MIVTVGICVNFIGSVQGIIIRDAIISSVISLDQADSL